MMKHMKLKIFLTIAIIILVFSSIVSATTCVGCATGTYTETHNTNQTNSTNFTIAKTLNGSVFTSSTISIIDAKTNTSGIYGSVNTTGLVGWWRMDETTGANVVDVSNNGVNINNGTWNYTSINSTSGKYNTGFLFNKQTDDISIPNNESLNTTNSISISVWINPNSGIEQEIIGRGYTGYPGTRSYEMIFQNTYVEIFFSNNGTNLIPSSVKSPNITANNWSFIVFTFDGNNGKMYANSILGDDIYFPGEFYSPSRNIYIGRRHQIITGGFFYGGIIDDVRIYNRSLSPEEIRQSYLVRVQQLQAKYTTNSTYSNNLNGTSSVSVPYKSGETYTALHWLIPFNVTDSTGVTCYDCSQQMQFKPTLSVSGTEDITNISVTTIPGYQIINYSWTTANSYNSSWINFTINDIGAAGYGLGILDNTTNRVLTDNYPSFNITQTDVVAGQTYYYNITKSYSDLNLFGNIINEAGQVVEGVSIIVSGTTLITSDVNGNYLTGDVFLHSNSYSVTYSKSGYYSQTIIVTFNLTNVNQNVILQGTPLQVHIDTCTGIRSYSDIAIPLFGLALMILAFGVIFITLKSQTITAPLLITTMMIAVIGFALILVGNYLLYAIYGVTC